MNTKNTASQPKVASIADDAQFLDLITDLVCAQEELAHTKPTAWAALVTYLDSKLRAPADQAASAAPEGFRTVLLPIDPTEAMVQAGIDSGKNKPFSYASCFRAMLAAAPQQSLAPAADDATKLCGKLLCLPQVDTGKGVYVSAIAMTGFIREFLAAEGQVSAAAPADLLGDAISACEELISGPNEEGASACVSVLKKLRASEGQAQTSAAQLSPFEYRSRNNKGEWEQRWWPLYVEDEAAAREWHDERDDILEWRAVPVAAQSANKPVKD